MKLKSLTYSHAREHEKNSEPPCSSFSRKDVLFRETRANALTYNSDYNVFLSPLADFKKAMADAGLGDKAVYLDRGEAYSFKVK